MLLGSFHDFLLRAPGRTGRPPLFLGSTFGGRMFPGVRSRGGQRILSVSRRGRDRAKGGSVLCTIAGWRHVRKGRQSIIAGGGRGNTTRPRQEGRRGRGTTAGSPADRSGGSIEGAVLCPASCAGASLSFGESSCPRTCGTRTCVWISKG